tara:strand:+ start:236 stop:430 length:195 start_codon:yes stop_codon:yes gene_type:complete
MTLTSTSTYKEFQTTEFYKEQKNYLMTQKPTGSDRELFTDQQAEGMLNSFYWRSYWADNLEGIS